MKTGKVHGSLDVSLEFIAASRKVEVKELEVKVDGISVNNLCCHLPFLQLW